MDDQKTVFPELTQKDKDLALTVYKSNQLIQRNRFALSSRELDVLNYCISKIKPTDKGNETYRIKINDVCRVCGIDGKVPGGYYKAVKSAVKKLDSFNFELKDQTGRVHFVHFIRSVVIDPEDKKEAVIQFEFDPKVAPELFNLRKNFTQFQLEAVMRMKSVYGKRLYELLKSYSNIKIKAFDLDELRFLLGADNKSYEKYGLFRSRVLDPAIKDIMTYSDLTVKYGERKSGNKVSKIEFHITKIGGTIEYYERQGMKFDE